MKSGTAKAQRAQRTTQDRGNNKETATPGAWDLGFVETVATLQRRQPYGGLRRQPREGRRRLAAGFTPQYRSTCAIRALKGRRAVRLRRYTPPPRWGLKELIRGAFCGVNPAAKSLRRSATDDALRCNVATVSICFGFRASDFGFPSSEQAHFRPSVSST